MQSTMMQAQLSLNHLLDRAGTIFGTNTVVSRLPDKSLVRHSYAEFYRRTRALGDGISRVFSKVAASASFSASCCAS